MFVKKINKFILILAYKINYYIHEQFAFLKKNEFPRIH